MGQSSKIALGGIVSALSIAVMFLSSVLPFLTYTLPLIAGALIALIVIEVGNKWAFLVYVTISFLSVLLLSDKEVGILYAFFFGYYPIIKESFKKNLPKVLSVPLKLIIYNVAVILATLCTVYIFGIPIEEFTEYGKYGALILLGLANLMFFMYDYALTGLITIYIVRWQKEFRKFFK